ncbi:hypothetical protein GCM10018785_23130 [Streptomyces longispororuber]|uniref:Uncharacterized protein n=1 Tax=Streptomyces longispororuber TaxID=68230 RepID=A0A919DJ48_9ACTN|nr:hypothetical protein GCM10018785_23130 [Streptomyces longispororuber]
MAWRSDKVNVRGIQLRLREGAEHDRAEVRFPGAGRVRRTGSRAPGAQVVAHARRRREP